MKLLTLKSGPLSMLFDPETAFLRHIRFGNVEIVRAVFAAIRDRDWNTIPFVLQDLKIDPGESDFHVSFLARCQSREIDFEWAGTITGSIEGVVEYRFTGLARSTFFKNRIGLCVLHPIADCAGEPCRVEHADGSVTEGAFPKWISPHQPFKDIAAISHPVSPNRTAQVAFAGEAFEMEDQRNWTDASFKTYSTPLALPFPVEVPVGTTINHSVTIELREKVPDSIGVDLPTASDLGSNVPDVPTVSSLASLTIEEFSNTHRPSIGLSMSTSGQPPSEQVIERLQELRPDHLRVDCWLTSKHWKARVQDALDLAAKIGAQLEIALFAEDASTPPWQDFLEMLRSHGDQIARVMLFHSTEKTTPAEFMESATRSWRVENFSGRWVVGTNAYFAELNRQRPAIPQHGSVCYSINPQVHAFDNLSIRETLAGQRSTVDSAHENFGCQVVVSPITLKPRFNPNATSATPIDIDQLEPETDPRQSSGFAAAWTVGVLSALATHPAIESLTFYETFGPRGVMDEQGQPYPVFDALAAILKASSITAVSSPKPLDLAALSLLTTDNRKMILAANMSESEQTISIKDEDGSQRTIRLPAESVKLVDCGRPA